MKNNKKGLELIVLFVIFAFLSVFSYIQSREMKVSDSIKYEKYGNVGYIVHLNDSTYYNKNYLEEGMQYISSIIDYIDINFNYNVKFEKEINYDAKGIVNAKVRIVDKDNNDKVIYEDNNILNEKSINDSNGSLINLNQGVKIDYKKYNDLTNQFKTNYAISANCELVLSYNVEYSGSNNIFDNINNNEVLTIRIPLSEQMINITKSNNINTDSEYTIKTNKSTINSLLFISSIVFLILTILTFLKFVKLSRLNSNSKTEYDKYIDKILRQYDAYITESSSDIDESGKTVIEIKSFKELLDVRNSVEKAIIYIKVDENTSKFIMVDKNEIYKYIVSSDDIVNKK